MPPRDNQIHSSAGDFPKFSPQKQQVTAATATTATTNPKFSGKKLLFC